MKLKHWRGALVVCLVVGVVVVGGVMATMAGFSDANAEDGASGDLPRIYISLNDTTLEEINAGDKDIKYGGNSLTLWDGDAESYFENVEIKGRGNGTWYAEKKPYQIKFSNKVDLLGMGRERKWILISGYLDHSLLRTDLAFQVARMINADYQLEGKFAELYFCDEYVGLYYVTRAIGADKNVVDLRDPLGIVVELDNVYYDSEDYWYKTAAGNYLTIKDVVADDHKMKAMNDFVMSFNKLELAIEGNNFRKIEEVADVESLAEYYLVSEFTGNLDAYVTSFYFYKDGLNDKIHAGPVWDFDGAFGNTNWTGVIDDGEIFAPETMEARRKQAYGYSFYDAVSGKVSNAQANKLVTRMMYQLSEMPEFQKVVSELFSKKMLGKREEIVTYIRQKASFIEKAAIFNNEKWGRDNFNKAVDYLADWIMRRYDAMEKEYLPKLDNTLI